MTPPTPYTDLLALSMFRRDSYRLMSKCKAMEKPVSSYLPEQIEFLEQMHFVPDKNGEYMRIGDEAHFHVCPDDLAPAPGNLYVWDSLTNKGMPFTTRKELLGFVTPIKAVNAIEE